MVEHIARETIIELFNKWADGYSYIEVPTKDAIACVRAMPAADVRPVVLCRDCDCWNDWDSAGRESLGNYVCSCAHWTVEDGAVFYTKPTDFCSYGKKREES